MHLKSFTSVAIFLLLIVNEAYSLKCYMCLGGANSDCALRPKEGLVLDCSAVSRKSPLRDNFLSSITNATNFADNDLVCMTITGQINSEKVVQRSCWPKKYNCDYQNLVNNGKGKTEVDACMMCNTDLCNSSSSTISAGIYALAVYTLVTAFSYRSTIFL